MPSTSTGSGGRIDRIYSSARFHGASTTGSLGRREGSLQVSILQYDFMVRALVAGLLAGALAPSLGVFIYLRRLSLIADTLSHVAFMGIAVGLFTKVFPAAVALLTSTTAAAGIEYLRSRRLLPGDAALAVFLYASLAVGVTVIGFADGFNADLFGYLFGSILSISSTDLWLLGALAILTVGFVLTFFSELAQTSFDTDLARTSGVRVNLVNLGLAVLTGATITLSMRVVGLLLVGALIIIPVIAALRVATGLRQTIMVAILLGMISAIGGIILAFYTDMVPGGTVVITAVGILIASVGWHAGIARIARRS